MIPADIIKYIEKLKETFFISLFCCCFLGAFSGENDWVRIHSEKTNFSFDMPGQPQRIEKNMNGIRIDIYQYRDAVNIFGVVISDFSEKGVDFSRLDIKEYYENMKKFSLPEENANLISEQTVSYKRFLAKEIAYTLVVEEKKYTYFKRFFFYKNYVFQVTIGGPSRMQQLLLDKKELFFNSIEFE